MRRNLTLKDIYAEEYPGKSAKGFVSNLEDFILSAMLDPNEDIREQSIEKLKEYHVESGCVLRGTEIYVDMVIGKIEYEPKLHVEYTGRPTRVHICPVPDRYLGIRAKPHDFKIEHESWRW